MKKIAPRPWTLERSGLSRDDYDLEIYNENGFVEPTDEANLVHIVKCVNMHDELIHLLKAIEFTLKHDGDLNEAREKIARLIAKAEAK